MGEGRPCWKCGSSKKKVLRKYLGKKLTPRSLLLPQEIDGKGKKGGDR